LIFDYISLKAPVHFSKLVTVGYIHISFENEKVA